MRQYRLKNAVKGLKAWLNRRYVFQDFPVRFIVSTGRTGTKFFEKFFNKNFSRIEARHEPFPDLHRLSVSKFRDRMDLQQSSRQFILERAEILANVKQKDNEVYIESSLYLASLIPEIEDIFGDYKILHVVRDPRTFVVSAYNKRAMEKGSYLFHGDDDVRRRLNSNDFPEDPYFGKWEKMSRFERICWHWVKFNSLISSSIRNHEHYKMMKFEGIFYDDKNKSLGDVSKFFEIDKYQMSDQFDDSISQKVNINSDKLIDEYSGWSKEMKDHFEKIIYPDAKKYGY